MTSSIFFVGEWEPMGVGKEVDLSFRGNVSGDDPNARVGTEHRAKIVPLPAATYEEKCGIGLPAELVADPGHAPAVREVRRDRWDQTGEPSGGLTA